MNPENESEEEQKYYDDEGPVPGDRFLICLASAIILGIAYFATKELGFKTTLVLLGPFALAMGFVFALVKWIDSGMRIDIDDDS